MLTSGFTNAPVSRTFLFSIVATSILVSVTDTKYFFYIQVVPHLWRYKQVWRILAWEVRKWLRCPLSLRGSVLTDMRALQACYTNSTEVLFAAMTVYHMRVIERLWGSRKFLVCHQVSQWAWSLSPRSLTNEQSFIASILPYTALLPPLILALILRPLSLNRLNYLPAGPTPVIFALLAQYHAVIPHIYKYRIVTSSAGSNGHPSGIVFTDKFTTYLLAAQLALSQFPGSALGAAVGWIVGYAWRRELLPGTTKWRLPRWVLSETNDSQRFEGMRRRLEGESAMAADRGRASGAEGEPRGPQRRTLGSQFLEQFRGGF